MSFKPIAAIFGVILAVTACSASGSGGFSQDRPIPGAASAAVTGAPDVRTPTTAVLNSDNRPIETRSGLNSDPANPNGAPGHPSNY